MPAIATAPARVLIVETSLALTESAPAAEISSAPSVVSRLAMLATFASTRLRIQLRAAEPAPANLPPPAPATARAAICVSIPAGRAVGLANVASTVIPPVLALTRELSIVAVTVSWMLLVASAMPTPAEPLKERLTLPARVAIEAVSVARTATEPLAVTTDGRVKEPTGSALMWASTVFLIVLTANEPPIAEPLLETAPPRTTLMLRASSLAATVTLPADEATRAPTMPAVTVLRMSLTPIEALTAEPPVETPSDPVPE